ncbi:MAG TPA: hypothetical protein VL418_08160 [Devosiaceae bacterium]|nr:hypothetical protein [Devosiaceae bacterium]
MSKLSYSLFGLALAAGSLTTGALAQQSPTPDFQTIDSDKNGEVSFSELQIALPNATQEQFNSADADKSGGLNPTELASITAAGTQSLTTPAPANNSGGAMSGNASGSTTK